MTRILRSARHVLAAALACLALMAVGTALAGPVGATATVRGTSLPPGWELCILQGLGAPASQANVVDLDTWQAAEGGSTNNTAAYNPFNTRRTTDVSNAPLAATISSNGFPAFANWLAGCSATVATLLQPNMAAITAALRAGNVSPATAFLASVDQSQWCAPTNGVPCYADAILGSANQLVPALLADSSALAVYGNVQGDLQAYQSAVLTVAADQGAVTAGRAELAAAEAADTAAQQEQAAAQHALRKFAIVEYVSSGLYASSLTSLPNATSPSGGQSPSGVEAQEYTSIAASDLVARTQAAQTALKAAQARRDAASSDVTKAMATLASADAAQSRALVRLVSDVTTMQRAGACTAAVLTAAVPGAPGSPAPAGSSSVQASPSASSATTTTASPPTTTTAPPSTTTTTTTTSTTSTTLHSPSIPTGAVPPTTSTTVAPTAPPPTTTTTAPATGTAAGGAPAGGTPAGGTPAGGTAPALAPQAANPIGLGVLQGCMATIAPGRSA